MVYMIRAVMHIFPLSKRGVVLQQRMSSGAGRTDGTERLPCVALVELVQPRPQLDNLRGVNHDVARLAL